MGAGRRWPGPAVATAGFSDGTPWLPIPARRGVAECRAPAGVGELGPGPLPAAPRPSARVRGAADGRPRRSSTWATPTSSPIVRRAGDEAALVVVRFGLEGGEIELPAPAVRGRVVLSSHDPATPTVGSRLTLRPLEAIILQPDGAIGRRMSPSPTFDDRPGPTSPSRSRPTSPGASPPPPTRSRERRRRTAADRRSGTPSPASRARSPTAARATSPAITTTATRRTSG